ncbi:MAG TPA: hypothetical protein VFT48_11245 [Pyrinomonadaceae bacterium]|nr:hypothetical protein [Pyrinomonadaceae bacterium]
MRLVKRGLWIGVPLLCAGVAVLVVVNAASGPSGESTWQQSDLALGQPAVYKDPIEEVSLMLTSSGFAPAELRPHGKKFLLSLDNRTDVKELTLRMARNDGVRIRELRIPAASGGDWSELFELQPGSYTFSELDHPNWTCTIVIKE